MPSFSSRNGERREHIDVDGAPVFVCALLLLLVLLFRLWAMGGTLHARPAVEFHEGEDGSVQSLDEHGSTPYPIKLEKQKCVRCRVSFSCVVSIFCS